MPRLFSSVIFAFFVILQFVSFGHSQEKTRTVEITENADYNGFDLRAEKDVTLEQCKSICIADDQCRAFTFNSNVNWCFLKSDFRELEKFDGAISGKIVEVVTEPDIGAAPKLSFIGSSTLLSADQYRRNLKSVKTDGDVPRLMRRALADLKFNNFRLAWRKYQSVLATNPDDVDNWLSVAAANIRFLSGSQNRDYSIRRFLITVALNGYKSSRTLSTRARALNVLSQAFQQNRQYRSALESLKASLALQPSQSIAASYQRLRERYGFRVTGNNVDEETNTPRICVQFSEPLVKSGIDYATFMTVDGKTAAIDQSERQLCAVGLEHGKSYRVTLRTGLPSTVGESLLKPVVINSYVRDRGASLRFDGNNFVLPISGRRGFPIISVNADQADLELFRIGERALSNLLSSSDFLSQLNGYSVNSIREELGQPIWAGKIDLKKVQNREAFTSFPVDEALPKREPGIYVLTALPSGREGERWEARATQWFLVSDIGLSTIKGDDGLSVFSRSLESALPIANLSLTLIARNNEILGTATTDEKGMAKFPVGLVRGKSGMAPAVLIAKNSENQSDFVFLDMKKNAFDLSDRGVEGRKAPGPIDVFVYHDRGIYRPGEMVNSVALMRDDKADAVSNVPLTFIYRRPDGVEDRRVVSRSGSIGGHVVPFKLTDNAMRGQWSLSVYTDPKKVALSRKSFLVEDFIPDRTEFELTSSTTGFSEAIPADISLDGKFLYGAPASDLKLEGEIRASMVRTRKGFSGYQFGLGNETDNGSSVFTLTDLPKTDVDGHAEFKAFLGRLPATTRPVEASITVRMREEGGRAIERQINLPVLANGPMIGVRMNFEDGGLSENSVAEFDVIAINPDDTKIKLSGLNWSLYKIERSYQWHRNDGSWRFESVTIPRLVGDGTLDVNGGDPATVSASVKWGLYRLEVESSEDNGPATSVEFSAGWYFDGGSVDTPDALEIAFDRESYAVGDKATLTITPQFAGEMMVAIGGDQLHETLMLSVPRSGTKVEIPVKAEWGSGAYVTTFLVRPGGAGDSSRLPMRAIGTAWLKIDPGKRKLDVKLDLPEKTRPNETLTIPVSIAGLTAGEEAYVTVAAVDVGILNLTRYTPPEPSKWYHGQRAMGLEIRDIYGRLIDGSQGAFGKLRTGGDASDLTPKGSPPTQKLFSFFSGVVKVDAEGKATIDFELPQFNGTARIMAVAWTDKGVGSANGDVIVRDAVVVTASIPKVLAPGDVAEAIVEIANTDGPAGNYVLSLEADDVISIDDSAIPAFVNLATGERKTFRVRVTANHPGTISLTMNVVHEAETISSVAQEVFVRPSTLPVTKRTEFLLLADGGKVTIDKELLLGSIPQGASVSINVSNSSAFDLPGLLMKLDRYPYGCAEQTTSRALPLLYLSDFGASDGLIDAADVKKRVAGAITRVLSYQSSSGSFGLWRPGSGDLWLDSYITDFLTRASEKGFKIPEISMRLAVDNLKNSINYGGDISGNSNETAYALYVLARNRAASAGDLRYYADTRLRSFKTPLARAHLAAALSLYNDVERANRVFGSAYDLAANAAAISFVRSDYGSALRDGAAMLALASESRPASPLVGKMAQLVAKELDRRKYTSTQENAWMLLAARALQEEDASIRLVVNGDERQGTYRAKFAGSELADGPITVTNKMDHNLVAVVSTIASPKRPLSAGGDGFQIVRKYYRLDGNETTLNDVTQNERFLVFVKYSQDNPWGSRIVLTDLLPGGFEIDNPRLISSAQLSGFDWLEAVSPAHTEFRKDRFVVAFNHSSNDKKWHEAAYMVRAVTPGTYVLPAATVEDMYRPQFQARTATGFITIKAAR
ncbi:MAG: hypothetical protein COB78_03100 [Hyphomicrobiales bacterium]|nr:MAG: hypothetical protein COB78_03100 [Hyphomicrobiales bacterium]